MIDLFYKIEVTYENLELSIEEVKAYCESYEWYPDAITNKEDIKQARMKNVFVLRKLIELGITDAIIYGYMDLQGKVSDRPLISNKKIL
jgi:hypothetical protein